MKQHTPTALKPGHGTEVERGPAAFLRAPSAPGLHCNQQATSAARIGHRSNGGNLATHLLERWMRSEPSNPNGYHLAISSPSGTLSGSRAGSLSSRPRPPRQRRPSGPGKESPDAVYLSERGMRSEASPPKRDGAELLHGAYPPVIVVARSAPKPARVDSLPSLYSSPPCEAGMLRIRGHPWPIRC